MSSIFGVVLEEVVVLSRRYELSMMMFPAVKLSAEAQGKRAARMSSERSCQDMTLAAFTSPFGLINVRLTTAKIWSISML